MLKFSPVRLMLVLVLIAPNAQASFSLQEALQTSFERNNRTAENELRLQYARERLKASWQRVYIPSVNFTLGQSRTNSRYDADGITTFSRSKYGSTYMGFNVNLWRGGADLAGAEADEMNVKAQEAINNSTDARIPNTKGAIASLVAASYFNILNYRATIAAFEYSRSKIVHYRDSLKDAKQIEDLDRTLQSLSAQDAKFRSDLYLAMQDFLFSVTIPAPDDLDTFEQVIESLVVPSDYDTAFQLALQKSPEFQASDYRLKAAQLEHSAAVKSAYSPTLDLGVSRAKDRSYYDGNFAAKSGGTTVSLSLNIPFSIPTMTSANAQSLNVASLRSGRDAAIAELKHSLGKIYITMKAEESQLALYEQNLAGIVDSLERLSKDVDEGKAIDFNQAKSLFASYGGTIFYYVGYKSALAESKFSIQKIVGSLFDETKAVLQMQQNPASRK